MTCATGILCPSGAPSDFKKRIEAAGGVIEHYHPFPKALHANVGDRLDIYVRVSSLRDNFLDEGHHVFTFSSAAVRFGWAVVRFSFGHAVVFHEDQAP